MMEKYAPKGFNKIDEIQEVNVPKRKLRKEFFSDMFNWHDENKQPIIDRADFNRSEEFAEMLYNIYSGKKNIDTVVVNFAWSKHSIYYLITKIVNTTANIKLKEIVDMNFIKIKG